MAPEIRSYDTFDAAGAPAAPALVLVHGSVVTRKMWLPQLRGLSDRFYVLALDLPGHGARAGQPFSLEAAVETLAALIAREAGGRALVVGLSLGGFASMALANHRPELVAGLVLSGCSFNFMGLGAVYMRVVSALMRRGWLRQSRERAEAGVRRMVPPAMAEVAAAQLEHGVYPDALGPAFAELAGHDFAALLSSYAGPVLILNGEHDKTPVREAPRFTAGLRDARIQTIPGVGHACNVEAPGEFNDAVRGFAQGIGY